MRAVRAVGVIALILAACSQPELRKFEGYADGDYVRVAVPLSGSLAKLNVKPGTRVHAGDLIFALDVSQEARARSDAEERLKKAQTQLVEAQKSGRREDIRAAQGALVSAQADLAQAQWRMEQMKAKAPKEGVVVDTLYSEGQWVQAGAVVVSILSPENLKIRFYVPAHVAGSLRHGQAIALGCGGCASRLRAQITYISPLAEAQSAIEGQERLRFLIEARPEADAVAQLRPGKPVEVVL